MGVDYPIANFNKSRITVRGGELIGVSGFGCFPVIEFNSTVDRENISGFAQGLGVDGYGRASLLHLLLVCQTIDPG